MGLNIKLTMSRSPYGYSNERYLVSATEVKVPGWVIHDMKEKKVITGFAYKKNAIKYIEELTNE